MVRSSNNKKRGTQQEKCIPPNNEFDVLRKSVKRHNKIKKYKYVEKITKKWKGFRVFDKKKGFMFEVSCDERNDDLRIYLELRRRVVGRNCRRSRVKRRFNMCRNLYVIQNYEEIICIWIRLALQYKSFEIYENIIDEYILFKSKIEKFVQLIEMGSRFRNQCLWHRLPFEVRKKIYETVVKAFFGDGDLMECKAFAKRLFP